MTEFQDHIDEIVFGPQQVSHHRASKCQCVGDEENCACLRARNYACRCWCQCGERLVDPTRSLCQARMDRMNE